MRVRAGLCSIVAVFIVLAVVAGCVSAKPQALNAQRSNLTPAMVKMHVQEGVTTQIDVYRLFGPPNIQSRDKSGNEVWMYDRQRVVTASEMAQWKVGGGVGVGAGGKIGTTPTGGVAGVGGTSGKGSATTESTSVTFTLMLTFNDQDIVSDFTMQQTVF